METLEIIPESFYKSVQIKDRLISATRIPGRTVSKQVAYWSVFRNLNSGDYYDFHTCNESSVSYGGNTLLLLFTNFNNNNGNSKRAEKMFPKLTKIFEELSKFTGAKMPKLSIKYVSPETCPIIFIDFENEWICNNTRKLMILKFIRSYSVLLDENYNDDDNVSVEQVIRNIVSDRQADCLFIYKNYLYVEDHGSFLSTFNNVFQKLKEKIKEMQKAKTRDKKLYIWSRHPSHAPLRQTLVSTPTVLRFGYRLKENGIEDDKASIAAGRLVINPYESIENSASKFKMKRCFQKAGVKTADWTIPNNQEDLNRFISQYKDDTKFIVKSEFGSRGEGLLLFENKQEILSWFNKPYTNLKKKKYGNYLVERYYPYSREYRLHVTKNGCFYTCRKMLKEDAEDRWYRNDSNSVWIVEENEMFQKPVNWKDIEASCIDALKAVGLDVGACDVRVQSARDGKEKLRSNPDWIICEINSAPGLGAIGIQKYQEEIHNIIETKLT